MNFRPLVLTGWVMSLALCSAVFADAQRKANVVSAVSAAETVSFELYLPLANATALEQLGAGRSFPLGLGLS